LVLADAIAACRRAPEWGGGLAFNEFGFGTSFSSQHLGASFPKGEWPDYEHRLAAGVSLATFLDIRVVD
jgi:hypothetical protein